MEVYERFGRGLFGMLQSKATLARESARNAEKKKIVLPQTERKDRGSELEWSVSCLNRISSFSGYYDIPLDLLTACTFLEWLQEAKRDICSALPNFIVGYPRTRILPSTIFGIE
jgi:hypothetical protein